MNENRRQAAKKALETMRRPGWKPKAEISQDVRARDNFTCQYCGQNLLESFFHWRHITDDHIMAETLGGKFMEENLATSCVNCNALKHGRAFQSIKEARESIQKRLLEQEAEFEKIRQRQSPPSS